MITVLVVDDDPVYRELLVIALSGEGYNVIRAENGIEARDIVQAGGVELVMVDLLMPLMDGIRFLEWLRQDARLDIPAIVLTSLDDQEMAVEARVAGASEIVVKPVALPLLLSKIDSLVSQSS